jgi:hypothetical protein
VITPFWTAWATIYPLPFLNWKSYRKVQHFLARQLVIITHLCETLKFIVSNSSFSWWKDTRIAINIPSSSKAPCGHSLCWIQWKFHVLYVRTYTHYAPGLLEFYKTFCWNLWNYLKVHLVYC